MGVLDAPLLAVVKAVLDSVGGRATLKSVVKGDYDPLTGERDGQAVTQWSIVCSPPYSFQKNLVDGKAILQGDFQMIISVKGTTPPAEPTIHMSIVRGAKEFSIVGVNPIDSGDQVVAYILHCRG